MEHPILKILNVFVDGFKLGMYSPKMTLYAETCWSEVTSISCTASAFSVYVR
jgi:hypothetical protein